MFDAFDDLINIIKRGIANTLEIYECVKLGKAVDLFGVTTEEINADLNKKITDVESDSSLRDDCKERLIEKKKSLVMDAILDKVSSQRHIENESHSISVQPNISI